MVNPLNVSLWSYICNNRVSRNYICNLNVNMTGARSISGFPTTAVKILQYYIHFNLKAVKKLQYYIYCSITNSQSRYYGITYTAVGNIAVFIEHGKHLIYTSIRILQYLLNYIAIRILQYSLDYMSRASMQWMLLHSNNLLIRGFY